MIGMCQCPSNNVEINQSPTGNKAEGKPEWKVTLSTNCSCSQTDVQLACAGFQTVEDLPSYIITHEGDTCSLHQPVHDYKPVSFIYAWDTSFGFKLISSTVACS